MKQTSQELKNEIVQLFYSDGLPISEINDSSEITTEATSSPSIKISIFAYIIIYKNIF